MADNVLIALAVNWGDKRVIWRMFGTGCRLESCRMYGGPLTSKRRK